MKKIYLIGDSIRHGADGSPGYGICVKEKLDVPVNDLYTVSDALGCERHSDWVHYNQEGSELLADAVIGAIEKYAGL